MRLRCALLTAVVCVLAASIGAEAQKRIDRVRPAMTGIGKLE
jgi:hypothetical protein